MFPLLRVLSCLLASSLYKCEREPRRKTRGESARGEWGKKLFSHCTPLFSVSLSLVSPAFSLLEWHVCFQSKLVPWALSPPTFLSRERKFSWPPSPRGVAFVKAKAKRQVLCVFLQNFSSHPSLARKAHVFFPLPHPGSNSRIL